MPIEALVRWFLRGDGATVGPIQFLSLEEAMQWRRETLKRNLPPPLSSANGFLPLIRTPEGFFMFDGRAGGLVLRRTKQPEQYVTALKTPIALSALLAEPPAPPPPPALEPEDDEDDEPRVPRSALAVAFEALGWSPQSVDTAAVASLCPDDALVDWFRHVGAASKDVAGLRLLAVGDALVARDELAELADGTLQAHLHHHAWMPLAELAGRHRLVFWARRGVRLHRFTGTRWEHAVWSRTVRLDTFAAALPMRPTNEDPGDIENGLWGLAEDEAELARDFDGAPLAQLRSRAALEPWFSSALSVFERAGERQAPIAASADGFVALLRGADGVDTLLRDGSGVVLKVGEAHLPWAPSLTEWLRELDAAWREEPTPGLDIRRNIVGRYTLELPWLPIEFARKLETMGDRWELGVQQFAIVRGESTQLVVDWGSATIHFDEAGIAALADTLALQNAPELDWEPLGVTLVFKPLK
jgi:hypothetical protein